MWGVAGEKLILSVRLHSVKLSLKGHNLLIFLHYKHSVPVGFNAIQFTVLAYYTLPINAKLVNCWITPVCVEIPHLYEELITYILHISQGYFGIDGVWFLDQILLILELWSHKALLPNAEEIITKCLSLLKFAKMLLYLSFDEVHWRNTGPTD